ncbi:hypothetical protein KM043_016726 [Ampulex compressa]|nr:hypothetical protein KM043_016726 [Ampulex compressa]
MPDRFDGWARSIVLLDPRKPGEQRAGACSSEASDCGRTWDSEEKRGGLGETVIEAETDMDDGVQSGLQPGQWLSTFEKGEKRTNSLGSGALRFIRTRSSIRRELKRQCSR